MAEEGFKRKLTAVFSADAVGYSRLMAEDEAATVKTIATYREIMASLIKQHRGRVVDSPGDNLLAEFSSVVDAVQCAVAVQNEIQTRNAELPDNRRMEFRIGINLGDVIDEEDRIRRYEEAITLFKEGQRRNPYCPAWYIHNMANSFRGLGRWDEAIVECQRALDRNPDHFPALAVMASVYGMAGRIDEGRAVAQKILKMNPKFSIQKIPLPYKYGADTQAVQNGLREVGLPD